jgi:hypothetical protein
MLVLWRSLVLIIRRGTKIAQGFAEGVRFEE